VKLNSRCAKALWSALFAAGVQLLSSRLPNPSTPLILNAHMQALHKEEQTRLKDAWAKNAQESVEAVERRCARDLAETARRFKEELREARSVMRARTLEAEKDCFITSDSSNSVGFSLSLKMSLDDISAMDTFSEDVRRDVAHAAGLDLESLHVEGIRAGSVIVDMRLARVDGPNGGKCGVEAARVVLADLDQQIGDSGSRLRSGKWTHCVQRLIVQGSDSTSGRTDVKCFHPELKGPGAEPPRQFEEVATAALRRADAEAQTHWVGEEDLECMRTALETEAFAVATEVREACRVLLRGLQQEERECVQLAEAIAAEASRLRAARESAREEGRRELVALEEVKTAAIARATQEPPPPRAPSPRTDRTRRVPPPY